MTSKFEVEIELKSSAEKYWRGLKEFVTLFPRAVPDIYESIEILEGDGKSVGSVFLTTLRSGLKMKERIESLDEGERTLGYSAVGWENFKFHKNFRGVYCVSARRDGATFKYSAEFDKTNDEETPDPEPFIRDFVDKVFKGLDAYILNA